MGDVNLKSNDMLPLTPQQIRAARAALGMTAQQVAEKAQVGVATLRRAEGPRRTATGLNRSTDAAIRRALEEAGIRFIDPSEDHEGGVVLRRGTPLA